MMDKELKESLDLSSKFVRAYGEDAITDSTVAFQSMFRKEGSTPEFVEAEPEPESERQEPSRTSSQDPRQIYVIRDVWYALSVASNIAISLIFSIGIIFVVMFSFLGLPGVRLFLTIIAALGVKAGWKTWKVHQPGIVINLTVGAVSFPAEDVENTFWEIITLKQFFNHWRRIKIPLSEILRIDNDTIKFRAGKNSFKQYGLNISGTFGSQQLVFANKQKRDECRALLAHALKTVGNKNTKFDFNLNTGFSTDGQ